MKIKKHFISSLDIVQAASAPGVINNVSQQHLKTTNTQQNDINKAKEYLSQVKASDIKAKLKNPTELNKILEKNTHDEFDKYRNKAITDVLSKVVVTNEEQNLKYINERIFSIDQNPILSYAHLYSVITTPLKKTEQENLKNSAPEVIKTELNWYVNNDINNKDSESSKILHIMLQKTKQELIQKDVLLKKLQYSMQTIKDIDTAILVLSFAAVGASLIAFLWPPAGVLSISLSIIIIILNFIKSVNITKSNSIKKTLGMLDSLRDDGLLSISKDTGKVAFDSFLLHDELKTWKKEAARVLSKSTATMLSVVSFIYDVNSMMVSYDELKKDLNELMNIHFNIWETNELKQKNKQEWEEFKRLNKIVVISESPQDKLYKYGGTGGTNRLFKRLIDGKIFTRKEMLSMSKSELASYNLIKVKRTVTKNNKTYTYEYIRSKYSNKNLKDNLG